MAEWCKVNYVVTGDSSQVNKLKSAIDELNAMEHPLVKSDFGRLALVCFVKKISPDTPTEGDNRIICRGQIHEYSLDDGELDIDIEHAWEECSDVRHLVEKCYPGTKVIYMAEERSESYYRTNDVNGDYFFERYVIDTPDDNEYFTTVDEITDYLNQHYGVDVHTEQECFDAAGKLESVSLHKFEVVDD